MPPRPRTATLRPQTLQLRTLVTGAMTRMSLTPHAQLRMSQRNVDSVTLHYCLRRAAVKRERLFKGQRIWRATARDQDGKRLTLVVAVTTQPDRIAIITVWRG